MQAHRRFNIIFIMRLFYKRLTLWQSGTQSQRPSTPTQAQYVRRIRLKPVIAN